VFTCLLPYLLLYTTLHCVHVLGVAVARDAEYEDFIDHCCYIIKRCAAANPRRENSLQESDCYRGVQVLSQWALPGTHWQRGML